MPATRAQGLCEKPYPAQARSRSSGPEFRPPLLGQLPAAKGENAPAQPISWGGRSSLPHAGGGPKTSILSAIQTAAPLYVLSTVALREMFSRMPIWPSSITSEVPPALKKGRLMPVLGMVLVTTQMFSTACRPT